MQRPLVFCMIYLQYKSAHIHEQSLYDFSICIIYTFFYTRRTMQIAQGKNSICPPPKKKKF